QDIFTLCTGRQDYPRHGFAEATIICGARSGKDSRIATPVAGFEACFGRHSDRLSKGERAVLPLVAQDSRGSKIAFGYLSAYFTDSKVLRSMLDEDPLSSEIRLKDNVTITCFPCTQSSL